MKENCELLRKRHDLIVERPSIELQESPLIFTTLSYLTRIPNPTNCHDPMLPSAWEPWHNNELAYSFNSPPRIYGETLHPVRSQAICRH